VGLKELTIGRATFADLSLSTNATTVTTASSMLSLQNDMAEFVRRNQKLDKVEILLQEPCASSILWLYGILEGLRRRESMSILSIHGDIPGEGDFGKHLGQTMRSIPFLQELHMNGTRLNRNWTTRHGPRPLPWPLIIITPSPPFPKLCH
jgi:hypothetical protein